jgi:oligo-1,6-glucosidase
MTNAGFTSIDQYRDLETINFYKISLEQGVTEADFLAGARANSRDNSRTPMQWNSGSNAGFSNGKPWISLNANYPGVNVEADRQDPHGVFVRYRDLFAFGATCLWSAMAVSDCLRQPTRKSSPMKGSLAMRS